MPGEDKNLTRFFLPVNGSFASEPNYYMVRLATKGRVKRGRKQISGDSGEKKCWL
jgi:hypothetical protein